jgi:hypothetical protein
MREALAAGGDTSREFRSIQRAVSKAHGDRAAALRNVERLLATRSLPDRLVRLVDQLVAEGAA